MRFAGLILLIFLCSFFPAFGAETKIPAEEVRAAAQRGLEEVLDLWRAGRYDDLYYRTKGRGSREAFIRKMSDSHRKPSCCWDRLQEVRMKVEGDSSVEVRAVFGLELPGGAVEFSTRPLKVVKEEGVWKVSQQDILALASEGKRKKSRSSD